jgi:hypothetical protein
VIIVIACLALLGLAIMVSRLALRRLAGESAARDPHAYWALGLVTPLPAWLVAFLGLLGTQPGATPPMISGAAWVISAAAALIGAITTEAGARRAGDSVESHDATRLWWRGVFALLPALGIALIGHAAPR